ncbi:hypothetical protein FSP39_018374 [Pinctada imbricata]|uniref:Ion transport domain-containing protein n=1 Tax=Pinctada imbricata TaxID=66713 RepID=A0AA88Y560_PINIB|nr:hypothetical protein FSP39_018374 [Pinctada imbricata]
MLGVNEDAGMRHSSSLQSLASELIDAFTEDSFQKEVAEKTQMYFVGKQEAETEVLLDRIIEKEGNKDKALLYIVSEIDNEAKVQLLVNTILHRGANPSATNADSWTSLHYAVNKRFKGVCSKLLESDAWPEARDKKGVMPYTLAYESGNDDICAMLLAYMDNHLVRSLHISDGDKPAEFSFHRLLLAGMQRTVLAVLDCMIEQRTPSGEMKVYYSILEADDNGRVPSDPEFNRHSKSPLQIIAKSGNKVLDNILATSSRESFMKEDNGDDIFNLKKVVTNHDADSVNRDEIVNVNFGLFEQRHDVTSIVNSFFYILTLFSLTFAGITAATISDPMQYNSPLQIARGVFEIWSFGMATITLLTEINQLFKHKLEYFSDAFNWIDITSAMMVIAILPLRMTHRNEQWHVFSIAYLLWTLRIFKYAAVFRQTGAYAQILWRILAHDFIQFTIVFMVILLAFSGALFLALRGEGSVEMFEETSSFWRILFVGVRVLIEGESIIEYTSFRLMSCILMVMFLFIILVLLLNILIAQLSDTYQNVQQDAQRGLEVNRAWIVARVELNSLYVGKGHRTIYYKESEDIYDIRDVLETWENPPLNEMNKYIQDIWDSMDSHKLNLQTVQNRLARQESSLSKIQ